MFVMGTAHRVTEDERNSAVDLDHNHNHAAWYFS
jgi:hypothetical protein